MKLHIECVQDKLDDTEKVLKQLSQERDDIKETKVELAKYRDLSKNSYAEIDSLKRQLNSFKHNELQLVSRIEELSL